LLSSFRKEITSPMLSVPMFKYFTALSKHATAYNDGLGEAAMVTKGGPPKKGNGYSQVSSCQSSNMPNVVNTTKATA
jgi:hypothetical protein